MDNLRIIYLKEKENYNTLMVINTLVILRMDYLMGMVDSLDLIKINVYI
jgi:hypothetical protein